MDEVLKYCTKIKRKLLTILDEDKYDIALTWLKDLSMMFRSHGYVKGGTTVNGCVDRDLDYNFTDIYTGVDCPTSFRNRTFWDIGEPYAVQQSPYFLPDNSHYLYRKADPDHTNSIEGWPEDFYHSEGVTMYRGYAERGSSAGHCFGDSPESSVLKAVLKGLCETTEVEREFIWKGWDWRFRYPWRA